MFEQKSTLGQMLVSEPITMKRGMGTVFGQAGPCVLHETHRTIPNESREVAIFSKENESYLQNIGNES